jgi:hypothetical protein
MVKLFTHKCFQRYPEFQIKELVDSSTKATVTNNSTTTYDIRGRNNQKRAKVVGKEKGLIHVAPRGTETPTAPGKAKATKADQKGKENHQNLPSAIATPNLAETTRRVQAVGVLLEVLG